MDPWDPWVDSDRNECFSDNSMQEIDDPQPLIPADDTFGCSHVERRCRIVAPCCGGIYWCRHCHSDDYSHELDPNSVTEVVCSKCNERQPASRSCSTSNCGIEFAEYYCEICKFWDNKASEKKIFHCEKCGICRAGGRDKFFHCDTCSGCFANDTQSTHVCVENSMRTRCPICLDELLASDRSITNLRCGHLMHQSCLRAMASSRYISLISVRCPLCCKSLKDNTELWKVIDNEKSRHSIPDEMRKQVSVFCNDCEFKGLSEFHVYGNKCGNCGGYNTVENKMHQVQNG